MSSLNYLELCRLCLVKDRVHIGIFEGEGEVRQIFLKIAACLPVKVRKDDRLPKQICDDCLQKVELLYQFWNQTANAEKQLLEWLGETVDDKTVETNVKHEHMEQDAGSELANSLSRVEAVLAEAREHESSDNDHFGDDSHKPETDSDDEPLSSLEPTQFINVNLNGSQSTTAQTQEEFLAPSAPSTSKSNVPAAVAQAAGSGRRQRSAIASVLKHLSKKSSLNARKKSIRNKQKRAWRTIVSEEDKSYLEPEIKIEPGLLNAEMTAAALAQQTLEAQNENVPSVRCTLCGEMVPVQVLEKHKLLEELYLKAMKCVKCDVSFKKKASFRIHIYEQHKIHHCKLCGKTFNKRQHYRNHKELVHEYKLKARSPCDLCSRTFANKQILKRHVNEVHFGQREPEIQCPQCDYKTYNRSNMKVHTDKHNNTPSFVCDLCGKGCFTRTALNDHTANTHGHGFRCQICGKIYKNECSLKTHVKIHEPGFDPATLKHQCEECGEIFNHKSSLNKHLLKHKGLDKTFDCEVCGKKVSSKGSYRSHMAIHSGYKPHVCEYCDKRFADKQYLIQHRRIHTGEKPFKCDECGQCFNQRSSLTRHKRYHLGVRR